MPSCWRWGAEPLCVCLEMSGLQLLAGVHAWRCWVSWVTSYFGFVCTMKLVSQTNKNWEKRQECMGNVTGVMWVGCFFGGFFCWFVPPPPPPFSFPPVYFPTSAWLAGSVILSEVIPLSGTDPDCRPPSVTAGGVRGHPLLSLTFALLYQLPL